MKQSDRLVRELETKIKGLSSTNARTAAFVAVTCANGWTKARVARWLGVTRARVGQKYDKLLHYAMTRDDMPVLTQYMKDASTKAPIESVFDNLVYYERDEWSDAKFADARLKLAARERVSA